MNTTAEPLLVPLEYFWKHLMGRGSRSWYWRHRHEPGVPQPVDAPGQPMLVRAECDKYFEDLIEARRAPTKKGG